MRIELLTTLGCHLCEEAEEKVRRVFPQAELVRVDIAESDEQIARYGERIPVVRHAGGELDWPFSLLDLKALVEGQ